jgi:hypothetical protein
MKIIKYIFFSICIFFIFKGSTNFISENPILATFSVCDTSKYEEYYTLCRQSYGIDTSKSETYKRHYSDECRKEAKQKFCKKVKGLAYYKNDELLNFIPCDSIKKNKLKKICNQ